MPAERIVTLLPSATEIVCGLGLRDKLVGITHECDYPSDVCTLPRVTSSAIGKGLSSAEIDAQVRDYLGTTQALYSLDMALLESLQPDLIITQALCDVCAVSEQEVAYAVNTLSSQPRLVNLEPMTLAEVFETIVLVGRTAAGWSWAH